MTRRRHVWLLAPVLVAVALAVTVTMAAVPTPAWGRTGEAGGPARRNPINVVTGDPKVFLADGRLYMVRPTPGSAGVELLASDEGGTWTLVGALASLHDRGARPPTMVPGGPGGQNVNFWGSEVALIGDTFVLTTSGNHPHPDVAPGYYRGAIFLATADRAAGPYTWKRQPIVVGSRFAAIDPSLFVDPVTGRTWITWTEHLDTATGLPPGPGRVWGLETVLRARELDAGLDPVGPTHTLLSTDVEPQDRERAFAEGGGRFYRIVEGQGLVYRDGTYFLHYGAGTERLHADTAAGEHGYSFNIATSTSFPARFAKPEAPTIEGQDGDGDTAWVRPGHGSIVQDATGAYWAFLHARSRATVPWRHGFVEPLTYMPGEGLRSPTGELSTTPGPPVAPCTMDLVNDYCVGGRPRPTPP